LIREINLQGNKIEYDFEEMNLIADDLAKWFYTKIKKLI
jgi:hypothetical protein